MRLRHPAGLPRQGPSSDWVASFGQDGTRLIYGVRLYEQQVSPCKYMTIEFKDFPKINAPQPHKPLENEGWEECTGNPQKNA